MKITLPLWLRGVPLALVTAVAFVLWLGHPTAIGEESDSGPDVVGLRFVTVPAGEFQMGVGELDGTNELQKTHPYDTIPDGVGSTYEMRFKESPGHPVRLTQAFQMATTEVTVGQFRRFAEATGYRSTVPNSGGAMVHVPDERPGVLKFEQVAEADWKNPGFDQADTHPVVAVSWRDASAFCDWISKQEGRIYRLPTESEWEYACRAGTQTAYSTGSDPAEVVRVGNLADAAFAEVYPDATARQRILDVAKRHRDGFLFTAPVANFDANRWGLHDMHGNVWEWTADIYLEKEYQRRLKEEAVKEQDRKVVIDPTGPKNTDAQAIGDWRVVRGGSWMLGPIGARSSIRAYWDAEGGANYIGFRVVRE